ncbi:MAG: UDP-glucose 4-epimerase GalE [Clostridia bacterium]|nr:UDP-glucose 4-epimerase GalE [Clostridia bacterium]MBQ3849853.1 UDP-glucose 4-epimerase GalE [Clostridia bacterium]MBR3459337.1 UDP-glucose 4-epimerase GalE [Clostridia bacterium]MBR5714418.1 UDP-glucose 4-epimerase GalE [Clostridia bacterium]MBR5718259.1 UDP-glucose 4-epimerase GalE [Clostridia bacterium]
MKNKLRVLLTGGCGYIGSHTAVELMRAGHEVVIADNLANSCMSVLPRIEELGGKKVAFYNIDVCDSEKLDSLFSVEHIDAVIHFAGLKCVPESVEKPVLYYRNNLTSTMNLLETMIKHGVNHIVFSSSATVYGESDIMPLREDMPTGNCTNPYGMTKHMSEVIIRDTAKANKSIGAVLLRYFNPIGADESGRIGEDPLGIPNNLLPYVAQFATGRREKLFVNGNDYPTEDGTCVRDFIHVTDLAIAHIKALDFIVGKSGCEVFNVGTGNGYSVLQVIEAFSEACGKELKYEFAPRRAGDIPTCYADPGKAEKLLGWKAERDIRKMCEDTWRWQSNNPMGYEK